jgi:hypothetical protein
VIFYAEVEPENDMKNWHLGIIVALIVGYAAGILFPSVGNTLRAKIGA